MRSDSLFIIHIRALVSSDANFPTNVKSQCRKNRHWLLLFMQEFPSYFCLWLQCFSCFSILQILAVLPQIQKTLQWQDKMCVQSPQSHASANWSVAYIPHFYYVQTTKAHIALVLSISSALSPVSIPATVILCFRLLPSLPFRKDLINCLFHIFGKIIRKNLS